MSEKMQPIAISVLILLSIITQVSSQECRTQLDYEQHVDPRKEIQTPSRYFIASNKADKKIIISGDVIRLDKNHFSFLFPPSLVSLPELSIEIQGRIIEIPDPIMIKSGEVKLFADKIRFIGDGAIAFTGNLRKPNDLVLIQTKELDLSYSNLKPLRYASQNWSNNDDSLYRKTELVAENVLLPNLSDEEAVVFSPMSSDIERRQRFLRNLTEDRDSGGFINWAKGFKAIIGKEANEILDKNYQEQLVWPDAEVAHIAEIFSADPFSLDNRKWIEAYLESIQERLKQRRSKKAILRSMEILKAIHNKTDLRGWTAFDVPLTSLGDIEKDFVINREQILGPRGVIESWDATISEAYDKRQQTKEAIDKIRSETAAIRNESSVLADQIPELISKIEVYDRSIDESINRVNARIAELRAGEERQLNNARRTARYRRLAEEIQFGAAAVGTINPSYAPIAQASGQVLGTIVTAIGQQNSGKTFGISEVFNSVSQLTTLQKDYKSKLEQIKIAWESQNLNVKTLSDKAGPLFVTAQSLSSLRRPGNDGMIETEIALEKASVDYRSLLGIPPQINLSKNQARDSIIQTELSLLSSQQREIVNLRSQLDRSLDNRSRNTVRLAEAESNLDELVRPDVDGNSDISLDKLSAIFWLRQKAINELRSRALVLSRSYSYRTGSTIEMPKILWSKIIGLPDEDENLKDIFDRSDKIALLLERSRQEIRQGFNNFIIQLGLAKTSLRENNFGQTVLGPSINMERNHSKEQDKFLDRINLSILNQIRNATSNKNPYIEEIEVPFEVAAGPSDVPERVIKGVISNVKFRRVSDLHGSTIMFQLINEGWGIVYHHGKCSFVRGVQTNGKPVQSRTWDYSFPNKPGEIDKILIDAQNEMKVGWELTSSYPFRTIYKVKVQVLNATQLSLLRPPAVDSMRIIIVGDKRVNVGSAP
ncbi:hypothetical protein [Methylobacterium sp. WL8]|uniref:hypothetical protein n=1 Tax=Methylobacterium sp. WL8 TaxID=2603899 RepID=UPI0011C9258A|nr:hypothetical protein [Methylobacterium sp. WL8]TXN83105.1 hypothetical protein FV234_07880 [Methylobacterium sp. WL8]